MPVRRRQDGADRQADRWEVSGLCAGHSDRASAGGLVRTRPVGGGRRTGADDQQRQNALDRAGVRARDGADGKSVVKGTSVSVRVDLGGRRLIKKKKRQKINN